MAVTTDILRTWRAPREVMRDMLARGPREDRAIAYLLAACMLVFVAQWPRLARVAHETGAELDQLVAYEFLSWLMIWPLGFYLLAALGHLAARALGGTGTASAARLALFWGFLAATPAGLFYGLLTGLNGPGPATNLAGAIWLGAFLLFWFQGLREAQSTPGPSS